MSGQSGLYLNSHLENIRRIRISMLRYLLFLIIFYIVNCSNASRNQWTTRRPNWNSSNPIAYAKGGLVRKGKGNMRTVGGVLPRRHSYSPVSPTMANPHHYQWPTSVYLRDSPFLFPQGYAHDPNCPSPNHRYLFNNDFHKYIARPIQPATDTVQAIGDQCDLPQLIGTGPYRIPRWYFNSNTKRCELFYYSGCCGNGNNFPTYEACQMICEVDPCTQPRDPGVGSLQIPRFFFNRVTKLCQQLIYFGSGGNRNNFATAQECRSRCPETPNPCPYGEPMRQGGGGSAFLPCALGAVVTNACPSYFYCHIGSSVSSTVCCPKPADAPDRCHQPVRTGLGTESILRWYFDQNSQQCKQFQYKGLQGNENNFLAKTDCENACSVNPCSSGQPLRSSSQLVQCEMVNGRPSCPDGHYCHIGLDWRTTVCCPSSGDPCRLRVNMGTGGASVGLRRWWHDWSAKSCKPFDYTGTGGNENNFLTERACEEACPVYVNACPSGQPSGQPGSCRTRADCPNGYWCHLGTSAQTTMCCPGQNPLPNACLTESSVGTGAENVSRWYYDTRVYKCIPFTYTGIAGNENNFLSKEDCLRNCPEISNPCPIGDPVMETGPGGFVLPVPCNPNSPQGMCPPNNWCHIGDSDDTTMCCPRTSGDLCGLPISPGNGEAQLQRWYFNGRTMACQAFAYTGTGGNENNFVTKEACEAKCPVFRDPCLGGSVQADGAGRPRRCSVPANVTNPCGPGFYCHIGGSEESTVCCPSVGNACQLPVAVGVGAYTLPRFYFNPISRLCLPFLYRGSHGNDNNYLSEASCAAQCPVFMDPCPDSVGANGISRQKQGRVSVQPVKCARGRSCPTGFWCHVGVSPETTVCCKFPSEHRALQSRCEMAVNAGTGVASVQRWYYNGESRECSQFQYKGMYGNANNFLSKEECERTCPTFINACPIGQPFLIGNRAQWCGRKGNQCPSTYWCHIGESVETTMCCPRAKNPCQIPASTGVGNSQLARWYFDIAARTCQQFQYRGLQGNGNNFLTKEDCETVCPVLENPCPSGQPSIGESGRPLWCNPRNASSKTTSCPSTHWCHAGANSDTTVCCPGRQDPCQLPVQTGRGNFSLPRWYFDSTDKMCKSFSYGGIKGNSNNFMSLEECTTVCPVYTDPCPASADNRTRSVVHCSATSHHNQWHGRNASSLICPAGYWCHIGSDSESTVCCPDASSDPCNAPYTRGTGTLALSRYYFDLNTHQCNQFSYSGLGGNQNNFLTLAQCEKECPVFVNPCRRGEPPMIGSRPQQCGMMQMCPINYWCHWGSMAETTLCCPAETNEPCLLPMEPGVGGSALVRWYYSNFNRQCIQFSYQGLRGNQNNFLTREECERTCRANPCAGGEPAKGPDGTPLQCSLGTTCPAGYWCHYGESPQSTVCCPGASSTVCQLPLTLGDGSASLPRFYYNPSSKDCSPFVYRGSGGNQNNFYSLTECRKACPGVVNPCGTGEPPRDKSGRYLQCAVYAGRSTCPETFWCHTGVEPTSSVCCPGADNPCSLPVSSGVGDANVTRWHYSPLTRQCVQFQYRGLAGNQNNFQSEQECARACPVTMNPCPQGQPLTYAGGQPQYCTAGLYPSACPPGSWCHYGFDKESTVCCPNAVFERDICSLEPNGGTGARPLVRWYFNPLTRRCQTFTYTGMGGNQNNFLSREECAARCPEFENPCAPPNTPFIGPDNRPVGCSFNIGCVPGYFCHLGYSPQTTVCCPGGLDAACTGMPVSEGRGEYSLTRWYFDIITRTCQQFIYRGIQGNQNNFQTQEECERTCNAFGNPCPTGEPLMSQGTSPFNRPQTCNGQSSTSNCPAGYWCHAGASVESTVCCPGASDPCTQPVATGVGNATLMRYYYDQSSRQCVQFTYSGSKGNQNNFPSMEACRMACREFRNPCIGQPAVTPSGQVVFCSATNKESCPVNYWCHIGSASETTLCCPGATNPCSVPLSPGTGSDNLPRYYYNADTRTCVNFVYNGLGGNQNNFLSVGECQATCPVFVNPCLGGSPAVGAASVPLRCNPAAVGGSGSSVCPAAYWCHLGSSQETTVCCPAAIDKPCLLSRAVGRGEEKLPRWYFDTKLRRCQLFEYSGMAGNQNNFVSQAECQRVCQEFEHPCVGEPEQDAHGQLKTCSPIWPNQCSAGYYCHSNEPHAQGPNFCCPFAGGEMCDAPKLEGEGDGGQERWYYSSSQFACIPFTYRGRKGNQNNFGSKEDCIRQCQPDVNACMAGDQPLKQGDATVLCSPDRPSCPTSHYCHMGHHPTSTVCCPKRGPPCHQPTVTGTGAASLNRWSYSQQEDECVSFTYTGRGGNENNFRTKDDCEKTCPGLRDLCPHSKPLLKGNEVEECGVQTACPTNFVCHVNTQQSKSICCPDPAYFCILPRDPGSCSNFTTRYGYSRETGTCVPFKFGGCAGNENNFKSLQHCTEVCCDKGF